MTRLLIAGESERFNPLRSAEDIETYKIPNSSSSGTRFNPLRSAEDIETRSNQWPASPRSGASTRFDPQRILKPHRTGGRSDAVHGFNPLRSAEDIETREHG